MDFLNNTFKMQRTSSRFIQKTLSFCYSCPQILKTNSKMKCLSSIIMQNGVVDWLGYTLTTWRTLWRRTHFQVTGTPLGWIHWNQSSPMRVFDGQRFTLTISAGCVAHPMPSWGGWRTSTASPSYQRRNFHIESDDKFKSHELGSVGPDDINTQGQNQPAPFTRIPVAQCSLAVEMVHWFLDWPNQNTVKLKSLRDKLGKWSDCLTDVRDKWSLWKLIGCFQTKLAQSKWKFGTWRGDTPWDPQARCRY